MCSLVAIVISNIIYCIVSCTDLINVKYSVVVGRMVPKFSRQHIP